MDELIPFLFSRGDDADEALAPVRVIMRGEAPYFVAADVCRVLGITNSRQATAALDDDEKGVCNTYTLGGEQTVNVVSESGLYALIFRSRKPVARKFRRWVTEEVIPSIRRTGRYDQTVAVGHHPQGPSMPLTQIEASLHQHQLRVLAALRAIANPTAGIENPVASITGFGQLADLSGLSVSSVRRAVRLLVQLGFVSVSDPGTQATIIGEPAGRA